MLKVLRDRHDAAHRRVANRIIAMIVLRSIYMICNSSGPFVVPVWYAPADNNSNTGTTYGDKTGTTPHTAALALRQAISQAP